MAELKTDPRPFAPEIRGGLFLTPEPAEPTRVYLTFDVEQHVPGPPYCLTGRGLSPEPGVYWIMDELEKFGFKGVFFVNIYEHLNFPDGLMDQLVLDIHARGHEVGLHAHAHYPHDRASRPVYEEELPYHDKEAQRRILTYGRDFLTRLLGTPPVSFRAGSYALNADTLEVLSELGFKIDSSLFPAQHQRQPTLRYQTLNRPMRYGELWELPLTTHALYGQLNKIDINIDTRGRAPVAELMRMLRAGRAHGLNDLVFMAHSFSFLKFTQDPAEAAFDFAFTSGRYLKDVWRGLMREFSFFLEELASDKRFTVLRLDEALHEKTLGQSRDVIPCFFPPGEGGAFCPVCENQVEFAPYRGRPGALCPVCNTLERMRFKYLYLKRVKQIETTPLSVLHIGPNPRIRRWLKTLANLDYVSGDPFNEADLKFYLENIPFADDKFDLIICICVLMHVLDDYQAVREMFRVLKPGGELLLYLGPLDQPKTEEYYDRDEFALMTPHDFSYPEQVDKPVVLRQDGRIYYNPLFASRKYGRDFLDKLSEFGFQYRLIRADELVARPEVYGVKADDILVSCRK